MKLQRKKLKINIRIKQKTMLLVKKWAFLRKK